MKQYNAGEFNKKITIQKYDTSAVNENGFSSPNWVDILTTYAKIDNKNGSRFFSASTEDTKKTSLFTIRYRSVLKDKYEAKLRIMYGNRAFLVQYINNIDEKNMYYEIMGEAVDING